MRTHSNTASILVFCGFFFISCAGPRVSTPGIVSVDITPAHQLRTVRPLYAIGGTVDKEPAGMIPALYSHENVRQILESGLGWLSYRLFTELSVQDWHWNPSGTFSAGNQGYWTSGASTDTPPIADSFGYRLPHRGNSSDQGNNEDYSRLDDGDPLTYWKSNPYLTSAYTGDSDSNHAQWIVVDLGSETPIDAARISWANPYAMRYTVDYWTGSDAIGDPAHGAWKTFPSGTVGSGFGGVVTMRLDSSPVKAQFVRLSMTQSSNTCDTHGSGDPRNCVGYAVGEISIGTLDSKGILRDAVHHSRCGSIQPHRNGCIDGQTATYTSSTDPWHSADNRVRNQEQPGLDLIARSGLTRGIGAFYPVPMLYSTPENAAAEIRYLESRHYAIADVELGEEPDGQYTEPEDYGALYLQWAKAVHAVDPKLKLGGPVLSGVNSDLLWWPDAHGNISWLSRFLAYLRSHGRMSDLAFMSFEHYPFDGCEHGDKLRNDLLVEPALIRGIVRAWRADGLPPAVPMYITEAGFSSSNFSQTPMLIEGALWEADYMASSLSDGIEGIVYYQDEPVPLTQNPRCPSDWGDLTMFVADDSAHIHAKAAQFFASQMLTQQWLIPGEAKHRLFPASTNILEGNAPVVTAYAAKRPDGTWSVMLVNKDAQPHDVKIVFTDSRTGNVGGFTGGVTRVSFGSTQYVWPAAGARSAPDPNDPPAVVTLTGGEQTTYTIPSQSITVFRGDLGATHAPAQGSAGSRTTAP